MNVLYHAHSGLRYLVLLLAVASIVVLGLALANGRPSKATRILPAAFTGTLDLQVLLGIGLVISGIFYDALAGHLVMMILAVVAAHGSSVMAKRARDDRRAVVVRLAGVAIALVLIVGGIMAIGRGVFGSAAPTVG